MCRTRRRSTRRADASRRIPKRWTTPGRVLRNFGRSYDGRIPHAGAIVALLVFEDQPVPRFGLTSTAVRASDGATGSAGAALLGGTDLCGSSKNSIVMPLQERLDRHVDRGIRRRSTRVGQRADQRADSALTLKKLRDASGISAQSACINCPACSPCAAPAAPSWDATLPAACGTGSTEPT